MEGFKERLLEESSQLDEKREKLTAFLDGEKSKEIDPTQRMLLEIQLRAMATYSYCLKSRLSLLG